MRHDFVKTVNQGVLRLDLAEAHRIFAAQVDEGRRMLASEGVEVETVSVQHEADMQFVGQTHVLTVPVARADFAREDLMRAFETAYWERFEVELREMRAQVVSLRTAVIGRRRPVSLEGLIALERAPAGGAVPAGRRRAWFDGEWRDTPVYRREQLGVGAELVGPGHRRAARFHHRDRAGRPGARGRARQPRDHRPRPRGRDATGDPLTMAQTPVTQTQDAQLDPQLVLDEMRKNGVTHVVWLPDSETNFLYQLMQADPSLQLVPVSREGLAFSIASGLSTGGQTPIILIQNTGLMESGDSLRGWAIGMQIPVVMMVGYRGWTRHGVNTDTAATYTERFLNAFGITYYLVETSADAPRISIAFEEARRTQRPVAVLMADEYHGFNR